MDAVIECLRAYYQSEFMKLNKQVIQAAKERIDNIYKQQLEKANQVRTANTMYQQQTLFHLAAIHVNKKENFNFLLTHCRPYMNEQDKNIFAQDRRGNTPLHYACSRNFNFEIAKELIGAGARLNSPSNSKDETAKRVLEKERFTFAYLKSRKILKYLMECMYDPDAQSNRRNKFFSSIFILGAVFGAMFLGPLSISSLLSSLLFINVKCSLLGGYELYCRGKKYLKNLIHPPKSDIAIADASHTEESFSSTTIAIQALSSCENHRAVTSSAPPHSIPSSISILGSAPLSANQIAQPASDEGVARLSF